MNSSDIKRRRAKISGATEVAYNYILENIKSGNWTPGDIIREKDITEMIEVSRTPVREAFVLLISENYLEKTRNGMIKVAMISEKQLLEIYKVRSFLEEKIIEEIIDIISEEEIIYLTALVNYLETVVNSELNDEVFSAMDEIHNYLAKILDNNILMDTLYTINCHISRYRSLIENVTKTDLIAIKENHKKILSFILSKDKKAAREHIVKWNQTSMKFMRKRLKEAGLI